MARRNAHAEGQTLSVGGCTRHYRLCWAWSWSAYQSVTFFGQSRASARDGLACPSCIWAVHLLLAFIRDQIQPQSGNRADPRVLAAICYPWMGGCRRLQCLPDARAHGLRVMRAPWLEEAAMHPTLIHSAYISRQAYMLHECWPAWGVFLLPMCGELSTFCAPSGLAVRGAMHRVLAKATHAAGDAPRPRHTHSQACFLCGRAPAQSTMWPARVLACPSMWHARAITCVAPAALPSQRPRTVRGLPMTLVQWVGPACSLPRPQIWPSRRPHVSSFGQPTIA